LNFLILPRLALILGRIALIFQNRFNFTSFFRNFVRIRRIWVENYIRNGWLNETEFRYNKPVDYFCSYKHLGTKIENLDFFIEIIGFFVFLQPRYF